jgi:hypothetical protein
VNSSRSPPTRTSTPTAICFNEKKQIIKKNPILEYIESDISIKDVGGLDEFTDWLKKRKMAFQSDASQYGLPYPKGVLMVGIPGGGKSLSAKATAGYYEMPLLRLDFGKMFGSLVGESERTSREAIKMAESLAPCVGGSSVIISADGKSYTIKDILNNEDLLNNLYIYALNEKNLKTERTKVKAVIKHLEQKEMLKIKTPIPTRADRGCMASVTPKRVATPLPPLKLARTG